jgi:hypothetical protein
MRGHHNPGTGVPAKPTLRIPADAEQQESAMALTDPWPAGDDTGYYDTPAGSIWRPDTQPRHQTRIPGSGRPAAAPAITRDKAR